MPGDVVVLSSTPIPGNEKAVANVVNELSMKGAEVICQDTHVSGHACQEDLKLIYSLVHPKFSIPIHGEYRHRMAQRSWPSLWVYRRRMLSWSTPATWWPWTRTAAR